MFDILTTAAIADELSMLMVPGRVQRTGHVDYQTVLLEIYAQRARHSVVAAIGGREPVCFVAYSAYGIDGSVVTPFSLLLRKYVRGASLVAVEQPGLDRIITLHFAKPASTLKAEVSGEDRLEDSSEDDESGDDAATFVETSLHIELMGRRSNVVLVDSDGRILDSLKRVAPEMSRVRPILPHLPYQLPPAGDRLDPRLVTEDDVRQLIASADPSTKISACLTSGIAALSPQMARDAVYHLSGTTEAVCRELADESPAILANRIRELVAPLVGDSWLPVGYRAEDGSLAAYAAVPLDSLDSMGSQVNGRTMSSLVDQYWSSESAGAKHSVRKQRLATKVADATGKARGRLATLEAEFSDVQDGDRYRRWGEAIYASLWMLKRDHTEFEAGGELIPLDPDRTPTEMAQHYFDQYRKAGRGVDQLRSLIGGARRQVEYLEQLSAHADLATSFDEIEAVRSEWDEYQVSNRGEAGELAGKKKPPRRAKPKPVTDRFGNTLYIGRSGPENDAITFEIAGADDYWLHARQAPGAHVIIKMSVTSEQDVEESLHEAASIAAYYSALRNDSAVSVDICKRRNVRKLKGGGPGMVTYRNERTVRVPPSKNLAG
ncbi:NFACT RNA binding domain-containing protein [soil metagenome]